MKRLANIKDNYNLSGLFTLLNIYEYNLKMLHWQVEGEQFDVYHELLEDYYKQIFEYIDIIAEYLVSKHIEIPKYGTIASEEDYNFIENKSYSIVEVKELVELMFSEILTYIGILMEEQNFTPGIKSKLDEMYFYFEKELDFKNKHRF